MPKDPAIYTRTMAKVFSQQGHHERAIEIYLHLLKQDPDQPDLLEALKAAEKELAIQEQAHAKELTVLLNEWIELMHKYRLLKKLNRLWKEKQ